MDYISMLNSYSIYHLCKYEYGRVFINNLVNKILNKNNYYYRLLDYYNFDLNSVRSYAFLECKDFIVFIDFSTKDNYNLELFNSLEVFFKKKTYLILICNYDKKSKDNVYYYNGIDTIWFAKTKREQFWYEKTITNLLYKMNNDTIKLYNHEKEIDDNLGD